MCNTDKMYDIVTKKFKWGGLDKAKPGSIYLDETITRMVTTTRSAIYSLADALCAEGDSATLAGDTVRAAERYKKSEDILDLMCKKLPSSVCPYQSGMGFYIAQCYKSIGLNGKRSSALDKAAKLIESELMRYAKYAIYYEMLQERGLEDSMSGYDQSIIQQIIPYLFDSYRSVNKDGYDALVNKFKNVSVEGVKISPTMLSALTMSLEERENILREQMKQEAAARAAAEAEAAKAAATESENPFSLEEDAEGF